MHGLNIAYIALLALGLALPARAGKLVNAPPPPAMPDIPLADDGSPQKPLIVDTPSRGQLLYENHCMACHESMVHIRSRQKIKSLPALQAEVARWALNANLPWGNTEVEEVARHLDNRYYHFK